MKDLNKHCILLGLLLIAITNVDGEVCCPELWIRFGNSCYYFSHSSPMDFWESELYCKRRLGHLVNVNTATENTFLKDHLSRLKDNNWWIGMTDEAVESEWRWTDGGHSTEFTDWGPNQPNYGEQPNQDCVTFLIAGGGAFSWAGVQCDHHYQAICEMK